MKTKLVMRNLFKRDLKLMGYTYVLTFAAVFVLPVIFALLFTGSLHGVSFQNLLQNDILPFISMLFLFVIGHRVYEPFKFYIQNGISRRTVWQATLIVTGVNSLLMSVINYCYFYLIVQPNVGNEFTTFYDDAFGKFLGSTSVGNIFTQILYEWLLLWLVGVAGSFFGSFSALMKKRTRRILWIAIPIALIVLLRFLSQFHMGMNLCQGQFKNVGFRQKEM
ncbi:hypothetical protein [Pediococcus damnosus]|uniref:hypothetical protein n=2 Tax=Pediococcus damnosus TaxID=51663 RepID=UPI0031DA6FBD